MMYHSNGSEGEQPDSTIVYSSSINAFRTALRKSSLTCSSIARRRNRTNFSWLTLSLIGGECPTSCGLAHAHHVLQYTRRTLIGQPILEHSGIYKSTRKALIGSASGSQPRMSCNQATSNQHLWNHVCIHSFEAGSCSLRRNNCLRIAYQFMQVGLFLYILGEPVSFGQNLSHFFRRNNAFSCLLARTGKRFLNHHHGPIFLVGIQKLLMKRSLTCTWTGPWSIGSSKYVLVQGILHSRRPIADFRRS